MKNKRLFYILLSALLSTSNVSLNLENVNAEEGYEDYYLDNSYQYKNSEYYLSDEEIDKIIEKMNNKKQSLSKFDGNIEKIREKIITNSLNYVENDKTNEFSQAFFKEGESNLTKEESNKRMTITFALDKCLEKILSSTNNLDDDILKLQDLCIVCYNELDNNYDSKNINESPLALYDIYKNIIIINYDNILKENLTEENINQSLSKAMVLALEHEMNHLRQIDSSSEQTINSINYLEDPYRTFLIEASAESELYNLMKDDDYKTKTHYNYAYFDEREKESLLFLLAFLKKDNKIDNYYNAIFDSNLEELYNFYDLETKDDIYDFYKILYALDSTLGFSDLPYTYYEKDVVNFDECESVVGYTYKNELFDKVLNNLIEYTVDNEDLDLKTNLVLLDIVKYVILNDYNDYSSNRIALDDDCIDNIIKSEQNYLKFLSEYYNMKIEDIKKEDDLKVIDIIKSISGISKNSPQIDANSLKEARKILNEFPLLEPILYTLDARCGVYKTLVK